MEMLKVLKIFLNKSVDKVIETCYSMDDREQYLLNEIVKLRKENAELREQIERYENEGGSYPKELG